MTRTRRSRSVAGSHDPPMTIATTIPGYSHTQKAPLCLIPLRLGAVLLCPSLDGWRYSEYSRRWRCGPGHRLARPGLPSSERRGRGDRLAIRFGPVPLFRRTMRYADIEKVEVGRTRILDGWGIHYSIRGGWVWNLWARDCVVVHLKKGTLRIGTDDAENLARFLEGKIGEQGA